jgi:glutaredoxin
LARAFWKSSGRHLVERDQATGWLRVTPDLIRCYLTRPEVHPVDESCAAEHRLFDALMDDPFRPVSEAELAAMADRDTADNYRVVLAYRDVLADAETLERAYLAMMRSGSIKVPPVFIDQLVHIVMAGILEDVEDPMRLRAGETFFREQVATTDDGTVMLADAEIVDLQATSDGGGLAQLLAESGTPMRRVELDVLTDENSATYWERSERFDTVIDMRFGQPANYAMARVIEAWIAHFLGLHVTVTPAQSIKDEAWRWHIGLDREATDILNMLYNGDDVEEERLRRILALYKLEFRERSRVRPEMAGRPVYLGLACAPDRRVRIKPQNLLINLPLVANA